MANTHYLVLKMPWEQGTTGESGVWSEPFMYNQTNLDESGRPFCRPQKAFMESKKLEAKWLGQRHG